MRLIGGGLRTLSGVKAVTVGIEKVAVPPMRWAGRTVAADVLVPGGIF
jgi:hypothetical protein